MLHFQISTDICLSFREEDLHLTEAHFKVDRIEILQSERFQNYHFQVGVLYLLY